MPSFLQLKNKKNASSIWSGFNSRYNNLSAAGIQSEKKASIAQTNPHH